MVPTGRADDPRRSGPPRPASAGSYRIGGLTLDGDSAALLRDGVALPLGRRAAVLLLHLVQHRGEIIPKEVLYEAAWPGLVIEESNLTVQISHLRRVLGAEDPNGRGWVETLPRRGYRFVGPADPASAQPAAAWRQGPVSNIPVAVPRHFSGREAALADMRAALGGKGAAPPAVALHGMPGLGKTMLAAVFAADQAARYRATWWVRAEDAATSRADLAALAVRLGWVRAEAPEALAFEAALDGLRREGDGVLLIYDNARDVGALRPFLPKAGDAHLIITSNSTAWRAVAVPVEPALWLGQTGAAFLVARTGRTREHEAAAALSQVLGGLPLAHEQAAAYVESLDIPLAEYQRRLEAAPVRMLDDAVYAPADYRGGLTVAKALHLAVQQAEARHPAAKALLQHVALLAAEAVPVVLFRDGGAALDPAMAAALAGEELDEALAVLHQLGLVSRELVPGNLSRARPLYERALAIREAVLGPGHSEVAVTLNNLGNVVSESGRPAEAVPLLERALQIRLACAGEDTRLSALMMNNLSRHLHLSGEKERARPLQQRALSIRERLFGPNDPHSAASKANWALLQLDDGEVERAAALAGEALLAMERALGHGHPMITSVCATYALCLLRQGGAAAALPYAERAVALGRDSLAPGSYNLRRASGILADCLDGLGRSDQAATLRARLGETYFGGNSEFLKDR